jgi:hypothetical protein
VKNEGNSFESIEDILYLRDTFLDFELSEGIKQIEIQEIVRGKETLTYEITDLLKGNCPGFGTLLTPISSPIEKVKIEKESVSVGGLPSVSEKVEETVQIRKRTLIPQPKSGYLRLFFGGIVILILGIGIIVICGKNRRDKVKKEKNERFEIGRASCRERV